MPCLLVKGNYKYFSVVLWAFPCLEKIPLLLFSLKTVFFFFNLSHSTVLNPDSLSLTHLHLFLDFFFFSLALSPNFPSVLFLFTLVPFTFIGIRSACVAPSNHMAD